LYTNQGIHLWVKIGWPPEDLGCDLIFLQRDPRFSDRMVGQVAKELAERLGAVQSMAIN
jgi:hypothetical protein